MQWRGARRAIPGRCRSGRRALRWWRPTADNAPRSTRRSWAAACRLGGGHPWLPRTARRFVSSMGHDHRWLVEKRAEFTPIPHISIATAEAVQEFAQNNHRHEHPLGPTECFQHVRVSAPVRTICVGVEQDRLHRQLPLVGRYLLEVRQPALEPLLFFLGPATEQILEVCPPVDRGRFLQAERCTQQPLYQPVDRHPFTPSMQFQLAGQVVIQLVNRDRLHGSYRNRKMVHAQSSATHCAVQQQHLWWPPEP